MRSLSSASVLFVTFVVVLSFVPTDDVSVVSYDESSPYESAIPTASKILEVFGRTKIHISLCTTSHLSSSSVGADRASLDRTERVPRRRVGENQSILNCVIRI